MISLSCHSRIRSLILLVIVSAVAILGRPLSAAEVDTPIRTVTVVLSGAGQEHYNRYAEMLVEHMQLRAPDVQCRVFVADGAVEIGDASDLLLRVGTCEDDNVLAEYFSNLEGGIPTEASPGPEGFALVVEPFMVGEPRRAFIAGVDRRGVLYGIGRLLLKSRLSSDGFLMLSATNVRSAPRFAVRSANGSEKTSMDHRASQILGARPYTPVEGRLYFEQMLLWGANHLLDGWGSSVPVELGRYDPETKRGVNLTRSQSTVDYGINYMVVNSINGIGRQHMKSEWRAIDHGRPHAMNACPSIPAAREMILESKEVFFRHAPRIDRVMFAPSDVAGCECDKCAPWSKTYYELTRDLADRLHRYHPKAVVYIANQEFSIQDNQWIFETIDRERPDWLGGYCYVPAGSENSTYGYIKTNSIWDRYPGRYPMRSFLRSRMFYLYPGLSIIGLPDMSHWKRAENGLTQLDPLLAEIYPRRTFNVRPADYHKIYLELLAYCDGLTGYSEGNFDDFNKFMLLRLCWNPDLSAKQIANEYYSHYCGDEAGELLAEAAFLAEANHKSSLLNNTAGVIELYRVIEKAWQLMPEPYRRNNWRYAMLAQRAAIDYYAILKLQQHQEIYSQVITRLEKSLDEKAGLLQSLAWAESKIAAAQETELMMLVRREAERWDNLADDAGAIRSLALRNVKAIDGVGLNWLAARIRDIRSLSDSELQIRQLKDVLSYDTVGVGEFYDNCGTIGQQPHFVRDSGELYYGTGQWPDDSRPSQRSYNYSFEAQDGLEFEYVGLDFESAYEVTLVHPNPKGVSFALNSSNEFYVLADGIQIGHAIPSGEGFDYFTFVIPTEATGDGRLKIALRKVEGRSRCTCISEIWVRKVSTIKAQ